MKFIIESVGGFFSERDPIVPGAVAVPAKPGADSTWTIELNSLEELVSLVEDINCSIVLNANGQNLRFPELPRLLIYDSYME